MALGNDRQYKVYKKHFEDARCSVRRDGEEHMIVNDRYRINLPTGWTTDLETNEKTRNVYGLASKLEQESEED